MRSQLVFPAFLDTVLQTSGTRLDPILRFYSLFVRHFVLSDTQVLDNRFLQEDPIASNLEYLFRKSSYDDLPFVLVLKRTNTSLEEIMEKDLLRLGTAQEPIAFSSLRTTQQELLDELSRKGKLTINSFANEVGYPITVARQVDRFCRQAEYGDALGIANFIDNPNRYRNILMSVLNLPALPVQFGLKSATARTVLERMINDNPSDSLSVTAFVEPADRLGRTHIYRWRTRIRSDRAMNKELEMISDSDFNKLVDGIVACADYAYLRNFADSSGTSFMIDNSHWLPSSIVNESLSTKLLYLEQADDAIERLLDIKEGLFDGYSSEHLQALKTQLEHCGFANDATWEKLSNLRSTRAFHERLKNIDDAMNNGTSSDASQLLCEHVKVCCRSVVKTTTFNWGELFPSLVGGATGAIWGFKTGGSSAPLAALVGCATGGGLCLLPVAGRVLKRWRQRALIDRAALSVADTLVGSQKPLQNSSCQAVE
jgi:hypothetical protein